MVVYDMILHWYVDGIIEVGYAGAYGVLYYIYIL